MTQAVTEALRDNEISNKEHPYLSWPQTIATLQITDAAAPIGLRHNKVALREHNILLITDVLPETPAADAGLCGGDVVEKIGSLDAAPFLLGGGKMGAAAEGDGTLALTLRRPQVEVPVADAPAALAKFEAKVPGQRLDMAPTPSRKRNLAPCARGGAEADGPNGNRAEEASLEPRQAEDPLCRRCGIHGVSKRKALQQNNLCCNKCPNHGPWCTMHDQPACRKVVARKVPDVKAMTHDRHTCEENAGETIRDMGVGNEDRTAQEDCTGEQERSEDHTAQEDSTGEQELADKDVVPARGCRMIKIENPFEKRQRVDEEKRVKFEEKRLKADEATRVKAEEKRLKADQADEAKRLKAEEKRLKADQDMMRVEAAAALHKLERAHQKSCDLERKRQDTRKREEEKAFVSEMQKRLKTMGKTSKGPLADKVAAENAAAEESADGEKAAQEEAAPDKIAAEVAAMAAVQAATAEANAEETVSEEAEMVTAELAEAKDELPEATDMAEISEIGANDGPAEW